MGNARMHKAPAAAKPGRWGICGLAGKKFHLIGAGGIGVSGLAQVLMKNKAVVTGSDQTATAVTTRLRQQGADIKIGHKAGYIKDDIDGVVISAAIEQDNPELVQARTQGCKIYKYAELLGELMDNYDGIAVSGTHGKSTTSGWLAWLFSKAGLEPNFIIGADVTQLGGSSGVGNGRYFIAEACEYDRSFLNLRPKIACILNIEADHLDYYRDENEIVETFGEFARGIRPDGLLVANGMDVNTARLLNTLPPGGRCQTFGLDKGCDFSAHNIHFGKELTGFEVYRNKKLLGTAEIALPGFHNIMNALAVIATAIDAGLESGQVLALLGQFNGVERRLTLKERLGDITVLDDYAHHPTEIKASLEAIRQRYQPKRLWCVFQPHQYSRTRFFLDDFAESFKLSDVTIMPQIYFVRDTQKARKEVNSQKLVERICGNGTEAVFIDDFDGICDYLTQKVSAGDVVVTMGAGDIWKVADGYIQRLRENSQK